MSVGVGERTISIRDGGPEDSLLAIGAFARRSRLSMKALRLYDRLGLLTPARVDQATGYRRYRESQLATARLVVMLRRLDMPLAQVAEVIAAVGPRGAEVAALRRSGLEAPRHAADRLPANPRAAALVAAYWEAVERRIASQRELAAHLQIRLLGNEGSFGMFEIHERAVPVQLVLTEQRHVRAEDLPHWIPEAITRLMTTAQGYGGMTGPVFVVYHGEVNQDSDGPVEVCVPIGSAHETGTQAATRREPAHREAYTRITKAQVAYPQILSGYDAVAQWLGEQGKEIAGPPREVYFTDFDAAGPNDDVCDIAFPIQ